MSTDSDRVVRLGEICGVHGVKGWVKVHSYTDPRTNLFEYPEWLLDSDGRRWPARVEACRSSGKSLVVKLEGVEDRDAARGLVGTSIGVPRSALPALESGEYYWTDLEGLTVRRVGGEQLGTVERLIETGANDVLVLTGGGDRLIPFLPGRTIRRVDLEAGEIIVDWDPSFWE